jgi:hypothetical protein
LVETDGKCFFESEPVVVVVESEFEGSLIETMTDEFEE